MSAAVAYLRDHTDLSSGALESNTTPLANNAKIAHVLFTAMVRDKIGYPLREIGKNAWEVTRDKPFEVHLPTRWSRECRIRDFGPGLSHRFIMKRYPRLGDSTKDGDGVTGISGWGFGSLSWLAYLIQEGSAGSFTVISRHRGWRRTYVISLDVRGMPQVKLFAEEETDEPSGLEVICSVRGEDVEAFRRRAYEILWSFEPRPVITPAPDWKEPQVIASGEGWTLYTPATVPWSGPQVRVGPVMYPISLAELDDGMGLLQASDCAVFEVGERDVTPTASREDLQYTTATKRSLEALIAAYETGYVAGLQKAIEAEANWFAANARFLAETAHMGTSRRNTVRSHLSWGGVPLREVACLPGDPFKATRLREGWEGFTRFEAADLVQPQAFAKARVVVEHSPYRSLDRFHALGLVGQEIAWFRVKRADMDGFKARFALRDEDIIVLDQVKLTGGHANTFGITAKSTLRRRKVLKIGKAPYGRVHFSEVVATVDMAAGGLVVRPQRTVRKRRHYYLGNSYREVNAGELEIILSTLERINALDPDLTVLVDEGRDELGEEWHHLGEYLEMRLTDRLDMAKVRPVTPTITKHDIPDVLRGLHKRITPAWPEAFKAVAERAQVLAEELDERGGHQPNEHDEIYGALRLFVSALPQPVQANAACPVAAIKAEWNQLREGYPLFDLIQNSKFGYNYGDKAKLAELCEYYFGLCAK